MIIVETKVPSAGCTVWAVTLFIIILCLNCFASYASNENCFEKEPSM